MATTTLGEADRTRFKAMGGGEYPVPGYDDSGAYAGLYVSREEKGEKYY